MKPIIRKPSCSSLEEELEENQGLHTIGHSENSNPNIITPPLPFLPTSCHTSVSNCKLTYSLSSGAHLDNSIASSRTRSRSRSRPISQGSSSFMSSPSQFTSLWDDDAQSAHLDLPPINPSDYMKTLLCQLAASISAMKTAYAHQQAALNSYKMQGISGQGGRDAVSAADKAMVEELESLSHLHWQLSLLQHMQQECKKTCSDQGADFVVSDVEMIRKKKEDSMMLKRYEGIITRFHDEMSRKEAVAAALKETLAKSMLRGEKLERRVKALQAQVLSPSQEGFGIFPCEKETALVKYQSNLYTCGSYLNCHVGFALEQVRRAREVHILAGRVYDALDYFQYQISRMGEVDSSVMWRGKSVCLPSPETCTTHVNFAHTCMREAIGYRCHAPNHSII